ncbi:MAG: hypothetical protein ACF8PN_15190 [Phycisphaerales bacterium]
MTSSLRAFMLNLIDYAGLFPPAGLDMETAVKNFASYHSGPHAEFLGRFITPFDRLDEFEAAAASFEERGEISADHPWQISALIKEEAYEDSIDRLENFEDEHDHRLIVASIETKTDDVNFLDEVCDTLSPAITPYYELALDRDYRGFITAMGNSDSSAKIRTGGLTADLFPSVESLAQFLHHAAVNRVYFKATAGLHHPARHRNEKIGVTEHGFLNVFGAGVAAIAHKLTADEIQAILEIEDPREFKFTEDEFEVAGWKMSTGQIIEARRYAVSFGSCSFDEPVDALRELGWL